VNAGERRTYTDALGANLRSVRQAHGLSLQQLEEKTGGEYKAVVVGSYERGDRHITVDRLAGLCAVYGVPTWAVLPDSDRLDGLAQLVLTRARELALEPARAEELAPEFPVPAQREYVEVTG
jgi:transcriptional regulator with XRE-family HTH domain